tara:strand:+ start:206 stop:613 length:408 start_codon:yes stop_codon:yes gene_type:complete
MNKQDIKNNVAIKTAIANIEAKKATYNFNSRKKTVAGGGINNKTINFDLTMCDKYFDSLPAQLQELIDYASTHGTDGTITVKELVDHTIAMGSAFSVKQTQDATHVIKAYSWKATGKSYKGLNMTDLSNLWTLTS